MPGDAARDPPHGVVAAPGSLPQETSWMSEETVFYCNSVKTTCKTSPGSPSVLQANWGSQLQKKKKSPFLITSKDILEKHSPSRTLATSKALQVMAKKYSRVSLTDRCVSYGLGGAVR